MAYTILKQLLVSMLREDEKSLNSRAWDCILFQTPAMQSLKYFNTL